MHILPTNITEKQKAFLFNRREKTKIPVSVQIREALDDYIIKYKGGEK